MRELPFDPELIDDPWIFDHIPGLDDDDTDLAVAERVKDAVEELPESEREVVECVVWGQMTKVETAEVVGRSRQSVHDVLNRALERLEGELSDVKETL